MSTFCRRTHYLLLVLVLFTASLAGLAPSLASADSQGGRYALVIGNSRYGGGEDVSGSQDALAMEEQLKKLGFEVMPPVINGNMTKMKEGLGALKAKIRDATVVVFFFAGHGFQLDSKNYLLPIHGTVDAQGSMALAEVQEVLSLAPNEAVKLIILDACRTEKNLPKEEKQGLARPPALPSTLHAFATGPDETAESGSPTGRSPYTTALLRYLPEPGLTIFEILDKARADLIRDLEQAPTWFNSGVQADFFLRDAVFVTAEVGEQVDDDLLVVLNGRVVLDAKQKLSQRLRLNSGDNEMILLVANGNSFHNGLTWERAEGWGYEMTLRRDNGTEVTCSEAGQAVPCFAGGEEVPYKSGPHHGKVFTVARAILRVDRESGDLTLPPEELDTRIWEREAPLKARNQGLLFRKKLLDMPLDDILGSGSAVVVRAILKFLLSDADKLLVTVRGNKLAQGGVDACMEKWDDRVKDVRDSLMAALKRDPKPFDSFDKKLTACVQLELERLGASGFDPKEIEIWTALEDHFRESEPETPPPVVPALLDIRPLPSTDSAESKIVISVGSGEATPLANSAQNQLAAVKASQEQLRSLDGPLLYASVSAADLGTYLPKDLGSPLQSIGISGDAQVAWVEPKDQQLVASVNFDLTPEVLPFRVRGEAQVHWTAVVERGALAFRASLPTLRVTHVSGDDDDTDIEFLKPIAEEFLRGLLEDWIRSIEARRIPLRLIGIESFDLARALERVSSIEEVESELIDLKIGLGAAAVLVDTDGIHILADAVVLTSDRFLLTVDELREDMEANRMPKLTSNQLAVLGECGERLALPETLALAFAAVCAVHQNLARVGAPQPAGPAEDAKSVLESELAALKAAFRAKAGEIEPIENIPWNRTVFAISRTQLRAGLSEILPRVAVRAAVRPPNIFAEIPPEDRTIRTPPTTDLRCDQVGGGCPSVFEYPPYNPRGCPSDCSPVDLGCQAWKPLCEILKQEEKTAYEIAKAKAQAAFAANKLQCETAKAAEQEGCRLNQLWLDQVADLGVGELRGGFELRDIDLALAIDKVSLGPDFETIDLRLSAKGGAEVQGNLSVIPRDLGHIVCFAQWDSSLTARVSLPDQQVSLRLQNPKLKIQGEDLLVTYELSEVPLHLQVDPPPVRSFLERNLGQFAMRCPVPLALAAIFPGGITFALSAREEILRDTYDISVPAREIPIVIPSQELQISQGQSIRIVPSWGEKSILFEAR